MVIDGWYFRSVGEAIVHPAAVTLIDSWLSASYPGMNGSGFSILSVQSSAKFMSGRKAAIGLTGKRTDSPFAAHIIAEDCGGGGG